MNCRSHFSNVSLALVFLALPCLATPLCELGRVRVGATENVKGNGLMTENQWSQLEAKLDEVRERQRTLAGEYYASDSLGQLQDQVSRLRHALGVSAYRLPSDFPDRQFSTGVIPKHDIMTDSEWETFKENMHDRAVMYGNGYTNQYLGGINKSPELSDLIESLLSEATVAREQMKARTNSSANPAALPSPK